MDVEELTSWRRDRWSPDQPSEPMTMGEVEAVRSTLEFYGRGNLIPRLIATIDAVRGGNW